MSSKGKQLAELAPKIMGAFHDLGQQHPKGERLSMRQYQALIVLNANETLTLTQFCQKLSLAPSTGTELANRLIDLGYFRKEGETEDRRHMLLRVTEQGLKLLKERQAVLTEMFDSFLEAFPPEDQERFIGAFEEIWQLIKKNRLQKYAR